MIYAGVTNWQLYDYCEHCEAAAGKACWDLRYARRTGTFTRNKPHRRRPMVPVAPRYGVTK